MTIEERKKFINDLIDKQLLEIERSWYEDVKKYPQLFSNPVPPWRTKEELGK